MGSPARAQPWHPSPSATTDPASLHSSPGSIAQTNASHDFEASLLPPRHSPSPARPLGAPLSLDPSPVPLQSASARSLPSRKPPPLSAGSPSLPRLPGLSPARPLARSLASTLPGWRGPLFPEAQPCLPPPPPARPDRVWPCCPPCLLPSRGAGSPWPVPSSPGLLRAASPRKPNGTGAQGLPAFFKVSPLPGLTLLCQGACPWILGASGSPRCDPSSL